MFSLPFVLCYATIALAVPLGHVVHERNNHVPSRWVKQSRVDARTWFPVRIGLSQENLNTSHELLMDVYVNNKVMNNMAITRLTDAFQVTP